MRAGSAIKKALKYTHTTQAQLCERTGVKALSTISSRLSEDNLSAVKIVEMLDAIGYELVIQPKRPGRRPEGQFVINNEE